MQSQIDTLQQCVRRRYNSLITDEAKEDVLKILFFVQSDIRFNQVATDSLINEIWEHIRQNESQTDFILGLTQDFHFLIGGPEWDVLIFRLASATTLTYEASISLDEPVGRELLERMGSLKFLHKAVQTYPWLATLIMLEMIDLDTTLVSLGAENE